MLLLVVAKGAETWEVAGTLSEKMEPTELLDMIIEEEEEEEDILVDRASLLDPEISSCLKSDDEDDGARVPFIDPTG